MASTVDNQQKYENYRVQISRLKSALRNHFYLEAIFIEYAIMEDRLEAILRHADKWHPKEGSFVSIDAKAKKVAKLAEEKKNPAHRFFSSELTNGILAWKEKRNQLIHALLKQSLHSEDLFEVAEEGERLTKQLCSKATSHRRALEKQAQANEKTSK
jgi:hypothetical protein